MCSNLFLAILQIGAPMILAYAIFAHVELALWALLNKCVWFQCVTSYTTIFVLEWWSDWRKITEIPILAMFGVRGYFSVTLISRKNWYVPLVQKKLTNLPKSRIRVQCLWLQPDTYQWTVFVQSGRDNTIDDSDVNDNERCMQYLTNNIDIMRHFHCHR